MMTSAAGVPAIREIPDMGRLRVKPPTLHPQSRRASRIAVDLPLRGGCKPPRTLGRAPRRARPRSTRALQRLEAGRAEVLRDRRRAGHRQAAADRRALPARRGSAVRWCSTGRAAEFERDLPFGVFVDALDDYLGTLDPRRLERLGREQHSASSPQRLPGAGRRLGERRRRRRRTRALPLPPRGPAAARARSPPTRRSCSRSTTCTGPTPASLELIAHLLRKRRRGPVLMVVAYRPGQAPRAAARRLALAERDGACERLEPGAADARARPDELLGSARRATATRSTASRGGNPFYLSSSRARGRATAAPASARRRRRRRRRACRRRSPRRSTSELETLGDAARGALRRGRGRRAVRRRRSWPPWPGSARPRRSPRSTSCVARRPGPPDRRAAAVPLPPPDRAPRGVRARRCGWRIGAHARAAAALEARGRRARAARPPRRALGARRRRARRSPCSPRRRTTRRRRAPGDARPRWFSAALRLLPEDADAGRASGVARAARVAQAAAGEFADARDVARRAARPHPAQSSPPCAHGSRAARAHRHLRGDHGAAGALLRPRSPSYPDDSPVAIAG